MGNRHPEVQDKQAHRAATALAGDETCCLPGGYAPARRHPDRRAVAASARGQPGRKPVLDWSAPLDLNGLQSKIIRPALEAIGLPASRPASTDENGTVVPATKGVRLHDLRHTAAVLWLTERRALYPGCEVARAQQLRADPDDVRRLHPRAGDREPVARTGCRSGRDERGEPAPLDGGLDMAACRRSRTNPSVGSVGSAVTAAASVSHGSALVAHPVQITGQRDIRSGRREGCPVADPGITLRAYCDPAALNTVGRSRWCGDKSGRQSGGRRREHRGEVRVPDPHF